MTTDDAARARRKAKRLNELRRSESFRSSRALYRMGEIAAVFVLVVLVARAV